MTALDLAPATPDDADALAAVSRRAFDDDIRYGAPGPGGPPGYDSPEWQRRVMVSRGCRYYKLSLADHIVGGAIVFERGAGHYYLGRIYLEPAVQNRGLGRRALALLWAAVPAARVWTLETPDWNPRTQHFYERAGFVKVRTDADGCHYELRIGDDPAPASQPTT